MVFAQCVENDWDPECVGLEQSCGCGGTQTRHTLCDGGCSEWNECLLAGAPIPVTESVCGNDIDEDCDGLTDCADPDCTADAICVDNDGDTFAADVDCNDDNPSIHPGAPEICNNIDDDCDAFRDEGLSRPCGTTDEGMCQIGVEQCRIGKWVLCDAVLPDVEVCDTFDNDCDGQIDEGCSCINGRTQSCGTDIGACTAGTQTCVSGAWNSCSGDIGPIPEICGNSVDDDCDGAVDEFCAPSEVTPAPAPPEPVFAPKPVLPPVVPENDVPPEPVLSEDRCVDTDGDGFGVGCLAPDCDDSDFTINPAAEELCDNVDNDCNAIIDDQLSRSCGSSDVGICTFGTERCSEGAWIGCTAVFPSQEQCDNDLDDNCNGLTDEDCTEEVLPADQRFLKQILDIQYGAGDYDLDLYRQQYQRAKQFLEVRKHSEVADGKTIVFIDLRAVQDLYDVAVYEYIPKHIASSADRIRFSVQPDIIQADPLVMWHFEEMTGKEDLRYVVDGEFENAKTSTIAVVSEAIPKSRAWYVDLLPLLFIPILGLVFIVLVQLAHRHIRE